MANHIFVAASFTTVKTGQRVGTETRLGEEQTLVRIHPCIQRVAVDLSPGMTPPGGEGGQSPPSSAEPKN
jgi:hypothetical protein